MENKSTPTPLPPPQARTPQNAPIDPNLNSGPTYDQLLQMLESIRGTLFAALEMKEISLDKCDRSAFEMATIASNGIFWRNKEIAQLREEVGRLLAESAPQEAGALVKALILAKTRLKICLGRMRGCSHVRHEVSLVEIPGWLEEMDDLLAERGVPLEETKK